MLYSWYKIGERIKENRKDLGISQDEFAEELTKIIGCRPLKRQTVAGWENGKPVKKLEQLTAMCELFKCDMSYLLCECSTKNALAQTLSSVIGVSEKAADILITYSKDQNPISQIISELIECSESPKSEYDGCGFDVLTEIDYTARLDLGDGCIAHDAIFDDIFRPSRELHFFVTPIDIYRNQLYNIHKSIDSFIHAYREKRGLPDYE